MKVKDAANCEVTDKFQKMMKALSSLSRLFFLSKKGVIMSILQPRMDPTRQALPHPTPPPGWPPAGLALWLALGCEGPGLPAAAAGSLQGAR